MRYKLSLITSIVLLASTCFMFKIEAASLHLTPAVAQSESADNRQDDRIEITPEEEQTARERANWGRILLISDALLAMALFAALAFTGLSARLKTLLAKVFRRENAVVAIYFIVFLLLYAAVSFPLDFYRGYIFRHKYGLSNQDFAAWFYDYSVGQLVGLALGVPIVLLVYFGLRKTAERWWIWVTAGSVPVAIFLMLIAPVFIAPLFNKFEPLRDERVKQEILSLAKIEGIETDDIFQVDASRQSRAINAYVNGIGATKRIVLYDTLLNQFSIDEIKFVMAHEMGHYVLGHVWKGIFLAVVGVLLGSLFVHLTFHRIVRKHKHRLGFDRITDVAGMPLIALLLSIYLSFSFPFANTFSRRYEHQADEYALRLTGLNEAAVSTFKKLARINVGELDPGPIVELIFYTHPSLKNRIEFAKSYRKI